MDRLNSSFSAESAALIAAEGCGAAADPIGVDPDSAGLQTLGCTHCPTHVRCPDAGGKAVRRIVSDLVGIFLGFKRNDRKHGSEYFLTRGPHAVMHVGKDCRRNEAASLRAGAAVRPTAQHAIFAFLFSDVDVAKYFLILLLCRHRTDMSVRLHRIANTRGAGRLRQTIDEPIVNRTLEQQPRASDAGLPAGSENSSDGAYHGGVKIRVFEHDIRGLAAQLQCHVLKIVRCCLIDDAAAGLGAGRGDFRDARMRDQFPDPA